MALAAEGEMNRGERQIIAEKNASTIRVLELLGFEYDVKPPRQQRVKGNKSPRVVHVKVGGKEVVRVFNSAEGYTWANLADGTPLRVGSVESLYKYLSENKTGLGRPKASAAKAASIGR